MKLFNSLSRRLEDFKALKSGQVSLYTCGPTVYDHVHIGNLRTYIFEDTLRRVLSLSGYKVKHVMNITDIEDKIFARATQEYPNEGGQAFKKLTTRFEKIFLEDATKAGIDLSNSSLIRATESISDMQNLIKSIPNKYPAEDGVYFDISEHQGYGVFVDTTQTHEHHRINNDEYDKDHVADFALWKTKKPGEPSWSFELDGKNLEGRPGWHIECSAMATKHLGQPFDIHTGGVDLKFPHHENEIAQSTAATNKPLANYFLHAAHLLVEGRKMSKSLNNFYTLDDVAQKGFHPLAFRLLMLQAHYRSQLNFSWESLAGAQNWLESLYAFADRQFQPNQTSISTDVIKFADVEKKIREDLQVDLNTPRALSRLSKLIDLVDLGGLDLKQIDAFKAHLEFLDQLFGFGLAGQQDITAAQKKLMAERETARLNRDYAQADKLRQQLKYQGIALKDSSRGVTWHRLISAVPTPNS